MQRTLPENAVSMPMAHVAYAGSATAEGHSGNGVRFGAWVSKPLGDGSRVESAYEIEINGEVKWGTLWFQS